MVYGGYRVYGLRFGFRVEGVQKVTMMVEGVQRMTIRV